MKTKLAAAISQPVNNHKELSIEDFPSVLMKLNKVIIDNYSFNDINQVCQENGIKYSSVLNAICNSKKKGSNFYQLLDKERQLKFLQVKPLIDNRMIEGALNGTNRDKELFYKLTGDIQTGVNANVNVNIQNNIRFPVSKSDIIPIDLESVENE